MRWNKLNLIFLLPATFVFFLFMLTSDLRADTITGVTTTIRIHICGDGVVEFPEDCEGLDLNGKDCESLGYDGGTLFCDISCEFETSFCEYYPEEEPKIPPQKPQKYEEIDTLEEIYEELYIRPTPGNRLVITLPERLRYLDPDGDGRILVDELSDVVEVWTNIWRGIILDEEATCDLNDDARCDVYDFSILLYYIE